MHRDGAGRRWNSHEHRHRRRDRSREDGERDETSGRSRSFGLSRRQDAASGGSRPIFSRHRNARLMSADAMTVATVGGVTAARAIAAEICVDLRKGEFLDQSFDRRVAPLDARDRRWTRELVYGMLRRRAWIDTILSDRVRGGLQRLDADVVDLLRLGIYQLTNMGSVPAYAAIAQTVELAKRRHGIGASKLVNAVLRRTDRERDALNVQPPADRIEAMALSHSHPQWLVARWIERWGEEDTARLLTLNNSEAPLIIRPYAVVREQLEAMLEGAGVNVADAPY